VARDRYFPVNLGSLRTDRLLAFDLHVEVDGQMICYGERPFAFTEGVRSQLAENHVGSVWVHEDQRSAYLGYMEMELPAVLRDPTVSTRVKAEALYATGKVIAESFFDSPLGSEEIGRSGTWVKLAVEYLKLGQEAFQTLVRISDTDYELGSHSVNVCAYALGLGLERGIDESTELGALGLGSLLHDIGKTRIDSRILRKRAPLTHAEFELMKRHVQYGVDILKVMPAVPESALIPVVQHNERTDGTGYPGGLHGDQIHSFGRITAIADVFDAMTTRRVFREAFTAFEAVQRMSALPLDHDLLSSFIRLLTPGNPSDLD
jgi:HD-GYP domain-containing protein (c-di-GMP phosphodiesterase class II)